MVSVLAMTIVAFMGLAFDSSYFYYEKRRAQTAADAGALAGAQELMRGSSTTITDAARKDTSLNRYTHQVNGIDVTVNHPPASGSYVGNNNYVEVIVSRPRPTWFIRMFGVSSATGEGKGSRRADGFGRLCVCSEPRREQFEQWHICERDYEFDIRLRRIQQRELPHGRRRMCRCTDRKLLRHLFELKLVRH